MRFANIYLFMESCIHSSNLSDNTCADLEAHVHPTDDELESTLHSWSLVEGSESYLYSVHFLLFFLDSVETALLVVSVAFRKDL